MEYEKIINTREVHETVYKVKCKSCAKTNKFTYLPNKEWECSACVAARTKASLAHQVELIQGLVGGIITAVEVSDDEVDYIKVTKNGTEYFINFSCNCEYDVSTAE
ncbi:MAG: hypothetical protein PHT13_00400 [Methanosarcina sp.]|nr:hypothetical protein [Methanosarcina sp.]